LLRHRPRSAADWLAAGSAIVFLERQRSALDLDTGIRAACGHWANDLEISGRRLLFTIEQGPFHLELHVGSALPLHREGKYPDLAIVHDYLFGSGGDDPFFPFSVVDCCEFAVAVCPKR
jgi:hypothetical protein